MEEFAWSGYLVISLLIGFVLGWIVSYSFWINDIQIFPKKKPKNKKKSKS